MKAFSAALVSLALATSAHAQDAAVRDSAALADSAAWRGGVGVRRDMIVPGTAAKAAAATLPELLAGRVPGLLVRPGSGAVASGSRLRLRGASGIAIPGDPLLVVDGVRAISHANDLTFVGASGSSPSRIDDFVPDDVERVEVLSGPAAIARYGPEAAGGAVEVWTRRGTAGRTRLHAFAEAGVRSDAAEYPASYTRVGRGPSGRRVANCRLRDQAAGACTPVADSLLSFNPLEDENPFRTGGRRRVGIAVEGGTAALGYAGGATAERDLGTLRMDSRQRLDARGSFALRPLAGLEVTGSALHLRNEMATPSGFLYNPIVAGLRAQEPGPGTFGSGERDTVGITQDLKRTLAVGQLRWSPVRWATVGASYGIDDVGADDLVHDYYEEETFSRARARAAGERGAARRNAEAFAEARYGLGALRLATTLGAERLSERRYEYALVKSALSESSRLTTSYLRTEALYARQGLAWRDRVFINAALRSDEPQFGDPLRSHAVSAEWELGREAFLPRPSWLDGFRLRAAYGRAEQMPIDLGFIPIVSPCYTQRCPEPKPPEPQRQRELEGGADAELLAGRVAVSLTAYRRQSEEVFAILSNSLAGDRLITGGGVENRGAEARVKVGAHPRSRFFWELVGTGALNRNRYDDGENGGGIALFVVDPDQQHRHGKPLGSFFGRRITGFADRDGDGIIDASCRTDCEVQLGEEAEYLGSPDPSRIASLQGRVRVRGVELSALLDHQGGASRLNGTEESRCGFLGICRGAVDPSAPLAEQARAVGLIGGTAPAVENATFTRLRAAAVTFAIPEAWARRFGGRGVELTVAGRNLLTWTGYSGLDPETSGQGPNPFRFEEFFTQPLARTVTTRLDVTF